jgi:hypothetical protein
VRADRIGEHRNTVSCRSGCTRQLSGAPTASPTSLIHELVAAPLTQPWAAIAYVRARLHTSPIEDTPLVMATKPKVAIACQGGGSHAAFSAGALCELLERVHQDRFDLVGLSGTPGGAIYAALAWSGLISRRLNGSSRGPIGRLLASWRDLEATTPFQAVINNWSAWSAQLSITAEISPYLYSPIQSRALLRDRREQPHPDLPRLGCDNQRQGGSQGNRPRRAIPRGQSGGRLPHHQCLYGEFARGRPTTARCRTPPRPGQTGGLPSDFPGISRIRSRLSGSQGLQAT